MPPRSPEHAAEVWMAEFDAAYDSGGIFITGFHPFLSGRRARLARIEAITEQLLARGDVWITTLRNIAEHIQESVNAGSFTPRVVEWPLCSPIPELEQGYPDDSRALR